MLIKVHWQGKSFDIQSPPPPGHIIPFSVHVFNGDCLDFARIEPASDSRRVPAPFWGGEVWVHNNAKLSTLLAPFLLSLPLSLSLSPSLSFFFNLFLIDISLAGGSGLTRRVRNRPRSTCSPRARKSPRRKERQGTKGAIVSSRCKYFSWSFICKSQFIEPAFTVYWPCNDVIR